MGGSPCTYLPYQPPGILAGFVFILIFFFGFDFLNKNFHFKHIYTEGICAVYLGELDPELGGWALGEGAVARRGPHSLRVPVSPGLLPGLFLLFSL